MARYRRIDTRIWKDDKFRTFDNNTRMLWFYVLTNSMTNKVGLYSFYPDVAAKELGIRKATVLKSLKILTSEKMVYYDDSVNLLWIPMWLKYNQPSGMNQAIGYRDEAEEYVDHEFGRALLILTRIKLVSIPGANCSINDEQAAFIYGNGECLCCKRSLFERNSCNFFRVSSNFCSKLIKFDPSSSKNDGEHCKNNERVVILCAECAHKSNESDVCIASFHFSAWGDFSKDQALLKLATNKELRERFSKAFSGIPTELEGIEYTDGVLDGLIRRQNAVKTPSKRRKKAVATQEQEQEQEQEGNIIPNGISDTAPPPEKPSPKEPSKKKSGSKKSETNPDLKPVTQFWLEKYKHYINQDYPFDYNKESAQLKQLIVKHGREQVEARILGYLSAWWSYWPHNQKENKELPTVGILQSQFQKIKPVDKSATAGEGKLTENSTEW